MKARRNSTGDEWMSLDRAAKELGVSREAVLALCIKGELVGQHVAGRTVVRRDSVAVYQQEKQDAAKDAAA